MKKYHYKVNYYYQRNDHRLGNLSYRFNYRNVSKTVDNFYEDTHAVFTPTRIRPYNHSKRWKHIHSSRTSSYYYNATTNQLIRRSDHWGSGVASCDWYLKGDRPVNCSWDDQGFRYGIIHMSDGLNSVKYFIEFGEKWNGAGEK